RLHGVPDVTARGVIPVCYLHALVAGGPVSEGVAGHSSVVLAPGLPIVGAVISLTVTLWATVPLELPQASTALQVLVVVKLQAVQNGRASSRDTVKMLDGAVAVEGDK